MPNITRKFTDIDLRFRSNPNTGDIAKRSDEVAIKQSIRNLVLTDNYERLFHPEIGSQVRSLLFEPFSPLIKVMIEKAVRDTIINFEPRVELIGVDVNSKEDENELFVSILFNIVNTTTPVTLDIVLDRSR